MCDDFDTQIQWEEPLDNYEEYCEDELRGEEWWADQGDEE